MFRKSRLFTAAFLTIALGTSAMAAGRGTESSINPQPLPPRLLQPADIAIADGPGSRVMINPQPLPPKQQYGGFGIR